MSRKTPPFTHYPKWTEARFWSFIRGALRAAFRKYPPKYEVVNAAKRRCKVAGRQVWEYQCSECKKWHKGTEVEVDHIVPCGSLKSFDDLSGFTERMFVGTEGLRTVCKKCHKRITYGK